MSTLSSILPAIRMVLAPPHRASHPFLALGAVVALAGLVYHVPAILWLGVVWALFCLFFFRDPERVPSDFPDVLVAAADGRITSIGPAIPPAELGLGDEERLRIATFLSVLDVHINRAPAAGIVTAVARRPGKFLNAALDKASEENERAAFAIQLAETGETVVVVQIAGLIARRIICALEPGDAVERGARFGLIRFGSRTDIYLPPGWTPWVCVGQRAVGGETIVAVRGLGPAQLATPAELAIPAGLTDPAGLLA